MIAVKRHFGMDWLRIGAFAILILYHSALFFGPHPWVVQNRTLSDWLAVPLGVVSPWRLMVLFAVSGFATAAMLGRSDKLMAFFRERSSRLLIPLAFGMLVIVPPQSWLRLTDHHDYTESLKHFWFHENLAFGDVLGRTLPHWEHLWFLGYLWAYTAILVLVIGLSSHFSGAMARLGVFLNKGWRLLLLPLVAIAMARIVLVKLHWTGTGMFDDWLGDIHFIPAFLFGYLVATQPVLWDGIRRVWKPALVVGVLSGGILGFLARAFPQVADMSTPVYAVYNISDTVMAWSIMIASFHLADRVFNRDHAWRPTLARAIFPAYLLHQTVIVLAGWYLRDAGIAAPILFGIIVLAVIIVSAVAYWFSERVSLLGTCLGVTPREKSVHKALATV
jgi:glucans biosynthesis protein C